MADEDTQKNTTGEIDPSIWDEQVAVTGRPNDVPEENSTFGSRAKAPKSEPADVAKVAEPVKAAKKSAARKK